MHHHGAGLRRLLVARKWDGERIEGLMTTLATAYREAGPTVIEPVPPEVVLSEPAPPEVSQADEAPPEPAQADLAALDLTAADRAMLDYASKLTRRPEEMASADAERLREAGFDDRAIHDICAITAYFAFVNRIADGLGVELESTESKT